MTAGFAGCKLIWSMAKRGRGAQDDSGDGDETLRLDRWLWAARFFKTRGLASEAIASGKVTLNDDRPKRGRAVQVGDRIRVQLGPYEHRITVRGVRPRRGPAAEAALLYEEDPASVRRRSEVAARLKAEAALFARGAGKPGKKERRELGKLRRRE